MFGRASNSVSTPTLGSQQQRVQMNAMKQAQQSTRQRQIYTLFSGGTSNRLLLSIRSGIPQEVDYALEILVQTSYTDAPVVPLEMLPGLPSALLDLISPTSAKDGETARRQLEAALVLRNLVLEGGPRAVEHIRAFQGFIFDVLVEILREDEEQAELKLYLLDLAEVYAGSYRLSVPSSAPLESQTAAQQLYPLLAQLAQSNDRALIIGAYTLLGALAMNENNESVFAFRSPSSPSTSARQPDCPTTLLLQRALLLTAVNDSSLLLPVLEFLYQHTIIPSNSAHVLLRRDLRDIFPLIASRIQEGSGQETWEYELVGRNAEERKTKRGQDIRKALVTAYPSLASQDPNKPPYDPSPRLSNEELQQIIAHAEPLRAKEWLHGVFEAFPGGEITQVALWQAYQKQFEPFHDQMKAGQVPSMLSASDVIKSSTEAYPDALPRVIEENMTKRFVITGIKPRPQSIPKDPAEERMVEKWKCRWRTCSDKPTFRSPAELYKHLETMHVGYQAGPQICLFSGCGQSAATARELLFHLRTHVLPTGPSNAMSADGVHAADAEDKAASIFTATILQPQTNQGYASGIGFVACLVLRNLARAVAAAAARYRKKEAQGQMDVGGQVESRGRPDESRNGNDEDEDRRRYGFLSGRLVEQDGEAGAGQLQREVDLTKDQLSSALNVLCGLEKEVIVLAGSNSALATYLMETLESIVNAKSVTSGLL